MQFTLIIKCDGAAFTDVTSDENNGRSNAAPELARLLHRLANTLDATSVPVEAGDEWPIVDTNGHLVGTAFCTEAD